jgi:very-short-patch-repair endonuclease
MKLNFKKYKKRKIIKTSKLENRFGKMLRQWGFYYKRQFKLGTKYYDFYLPKYKLVIEVMGDYWHGNKSMYHVLNKIQLESKTNDIYKKQLAKIHKLNYIDIWEHEINKTPIKVKQKLFKKIEEIEGKINE